MVSFSPPFRMLSSLLRLSCCRKMMPMPQKGIKTSLCSAKHHSMQHALTQLDAYALQQAVDQCAECAVLCYATSNVLCYAMLGVQ